MEEKINHYTNKDMEQALITISSLLHKCQKSQEKILKGTAQWTLLKNRINALHISLSLIKKAIDDEVF